MSSCLPPSAPAPSYYQYAPSCSDEESHDPASEAIPRAFQADNELTLSLGMAGIRTVSPSLATDTTDLPLLA